MLLLAECLDINLKEFNGDDNHDLRWFLREIIEKVKKIDDRYEKNEKRRNRLEKILEGCYVDFITSSFVNFITHSGAKIVFNRNSLLHFNSNIERVCSLG
jgi:hypothetical protein